MSSFSFKGIGIPQSAQPQPGGSNAPYVPPQWVENDSGLLMPYRQAIYITSEDGTILPTFTDLPPADDPAGVGSTQVDLSAGSLPGINVNAAITEMAVAGPGIDTSTSNPPASGSLQNGATVQFQYFIVWPYYPGSVPHFGLIGSFSDGNPAGWTPAGYTSTVWGTDAGSGEPSQAETVSLETIPFTNGTGPTPLDLGTSKSYNGFFAYTDNEITYTGGEGDPYPVYLGITVQVFWNPPS